MRFFFGRLLRLNLFFFGNILFWLKLSWLGIIELGKLFMRFWGLCWYLDLFDIFWKCVLELYGWLIVVWLYVLIGWLDWKRILWFDVGLVFCWLNGFWVLVILFFILEFKKFNVLLFIFFLMSRNIFFIFCLLTWGKILFVLYRIFRSFFWGRVWVWFYMDVVEGICFWEVGVVGGGCWDGGCESI